MSVFEMIFVLWLFIGTVKFLISFLTFLYIYITNDFDRVDVIDVLMMFINSVMLFAGAVILWPIILFREKAGFFSFPNREIAKIVIERYDKTNRS